MVDQAALTPIVRRSMNDTSFEITRWEYQRIYGGLSVGGAVHRFSGAGVKQDQEIPWSLILKTLHPQADSLDPSAWNYYKREADAYRSGFLDDLSGNFSAARSFCTTEYPDGTCWIWLEDVKEEIGERWPIQHYGVVARHLGQFSGSYLTGLPLPEGNWLSSDWLRKGSATAATAIEPLRNSLDHPMIRRWFPGDTSDQFFQLWEERDLFLDALDQLPQTICHFDVYHHNLFANHTVDGNPQTIAIDWAYVGKGPLGADLHPLLLATVSFGAVGLGKIHILDELIFDSYLEGLRDVGWGGDPQLVRLGYLAAGLRYKFSNIGRWLRIGLDKSLHKGIEQAFGYPIEDAFDVYGQIGILGFKFMDEAREIINHLG